MNQTYNSARRCVSAKMQISKPENSNNNANSNENIEIIDLNDLSKLSNEDSAEKDSLLDPETEELIYIRRNIDANKEEQMRKMNLLPGKTFFSQRSKSISIDHVPNSKKKLDTQKARIPFSPSTIQNKANSNLNKNSVKNLEALSTNLSVFSNVNMPVSSCNSNFSVNGSFSVASPRLVASNLASQHQEEIYALINKKKSKDLLNLNKLADNGLNSKLHLNVNTNEKLVSSIGTKKSYKSSLKTYKRPKTSKL